MVKLFKHNPSSPEKPSLSPNVVLALESALYYAGFSHWPGIAYLDFTPKVFEDIILTLEVSNGKADFETFPISVVNYPVENYPPYIEDVDDQFFLVGEENSYSLSVTDCTDISCLILCFRNLSALLISMIKIFECWNCTY